jgi:cytoskeleton protein RodZ
MARKTKESDEQNKIMVSDPELTQVEYDAHYRSRCGGALRAARENQGLSIPDIASRLRLSAKQIEAIEADNFSALPEPTIVRGFIRNYAKQLKINPEPLLDAYNVFVPSTTPHELIVKPSANMKMTSREKPKPGSYIWAGLAVLLGLGTWLFYENYVQKPSPTVPSASIKGVESLPEAALPAAERAIEPLQASTELNMPPADTAANFPTAAVANTGDVSTRNAEQIVPAPAIVPPTTVLLEPVVTPDANGMAKLEFSASQETWVNVKDASGREVYSKVIFAGSRESIDVKLPSNVTVGNAGATNLSMNGKSIELAPYSRNNVAHVKLE